MKEWLKSKNLPLLASWLMKFILIAIFGLEVFSGDYLTGIAAFLALGISLLPMFIARNYATNAPWPIDVSITAALALHMTGVFYDLYHNPQWWWWDNMTHLLGTAVIAFLAFYLIFILDYTNKVRLSLPLMTLFTWTMALAIGAVWEIAEFYIDVAFHTNLVQGIEDTIYDLIFDIAGAVIVSMVGVWYVRRLKRRGHGL